MNDRDFLKIYGLLSKDFVKLLSDDIDLKKSNSILSKRFKLEKLSPFVKPAQSQANTRVNIVKELNRLVKFQYDFLKQILDKVIIPKYIHNQIKSLDILIQTTIKYCKQNNEEDENIIKKIIGPCFTIIGYIKILGQLPGYIKILEQLPKKELPKTTQFYFERKSHNVGYMAHKVLEGYNPHDRQEIEVLKKREVLNLVVPVLHGVRPQHKLKQMAENVLLARGEKDEIQIIQMVDDALLTAHTRSIQRQDALAHSLKLWQQQARSMERQVSDDHGATLISLNQAILAENSLQEALTPSRGGGGRHLQTTLRKYNKKHTITHDKKSKQKSKKNKKSKPLKKTKKKKRLKSRNRKSKLKRKKTKKKIVKSRKKSRKIKVKNKTKKKY